MGLSYFYAFSAPATVLAGELEAFLKTVETKAKLMGFSPTMVVNATFDNPERQEFARRLTTGLKLENEKLKGVVLLADDQVWSHDPVSGFCRVIPKQGVLLILTDDHKCESPFGFFRYPETLKDLNGRDVVRTGAGKRWIFQDFVDSPDPRYRQIVKLFVDVGYCDGERDEWVKAKEPDNTITSRTGIFEDFELTFGSTGHQYTTIDGQRYITWFNHHAPELKGLKPGCVVEFRVTPAPTVMCDSPHIEENLPSATLLRVVEPK